MFDKNKSIVLKGDGEINNTITNNSYNFYNILKDYNKQEKKKKKIFKVTTKISRYKGVSKNKKKWQVYLRIKNKNTYFGSYSSENTAAKIYDIMLIKKLGSKAKTNFKYDKSKINQILKLNINIDNILEILNNNNI